MSASQDKSQKITFVYSNLYHLYRKGKNAAMGSNPVSGPVPSPSPAPGLETPVRPAPAGRNVIGLTRAKILKAQDLKGLRSSKSSDSGTTSFFRPMGAYPLPKTLQQPAAKISEYRPTELLSKRLAPGSESVSPETTGAALQAQAEAVKSLKGNLKALNDLHSRLRFMLEELEELVKKE